MRTMEAAERETDVRVAENAGTAAPEGRMHFRNFQVTDTILATFFYLFVFQVSVVHGQSMKPTLRRGDRLIIDKVSLLFCSPRRFDLVVFRSPDGADRECIKRVIGMPTEEVEVLGDKVLINGETLDQDFPYVPGYDFHGPATVPEGCYFVLGDNRAASTDSRTWGDSGWVTRSHIKGIARLRVAPVSRAGLL